MICFPINPIRFGSRTRGPNGVGWCRNKNLQEVASVAWAARAESTTTTTTATAATQPTTPRRRSTLTGRTPRRRWVTAPAASTTASSKTGTTPASWRLAAVSASTMTCLWADPAASPPPDSLRRCDVITSRIGVTYERVWYIVLPVTLDPVRV